MRDCPLTCNIPARYQGLFHIPNLQWICEVGIQGGLGGGSPHCLWCESWAEFVGTQLVSKHPLLDGPELPLNLAVSQGEGPLCAGHGNPGSLPSLTLLLDPKHPILWSPLGIWMELEGPPSRKGAFPPRKPQHKAVRELKVTLGLTFIREPGGVPRRCSQDIYAKGGTISDSLTMGQDEQGLWAGPGSEGRPSVNGAGPEGHGSPAVSRIWVWPFHNRSGWIVAFQGREGFGAWSVPGSGLVQGRRHISWCPSIRRG